MHDHAYRFYNFEDEGAAVVAHHFQQCWVHFSREATPSLQHWNMHLLRGFMADCLCDWTEFYVSRHQFGENHCLQPFEYSHLNVVHLGFWEEPLYPFHRDLVWSADEDVIPYIEDEPEDAIMCALLPFVFLTGGTLRLLLSLDLS